MLNITITEYTHSWGSYTIVPYLFFVFKAAAILLIGSFCSTNPPPILVYSRMPWCIHQPMNGVWQEITPPSRSPMYILLIIFHANFQRNSIMLELRLMFQYHACVPKVRYPLSGVMDCISCHTFVYVQISAKVKRVTDT